MKIKHTPSQLEKAQELLQLISIWGVSRLDAVAIGHLFASQAVDMTDRQYKALSGGAHIKPVDPTELGEPLTDAKIASLIHQDN